MLWLLNHGTLAISCQQFVKRINWNLPKMPIVAGGSRNCRPAPPRRLEFAPDVRTWKYYDPVILAHNFWCSCSRHGRKEGEREECLICLILICQQAVARAFTGPFLLRSPGKIFSITTAPRSGRGYWQQ